MEGMITTGKIFLNLRVVLAPGSPGVLNPHLPRRAGIAKEHPWAPHSIAVTSKQYFQTQHSRPMLEASPLLQAPFSDEAETPSAAFFLTFRWVIPNRLSSTSQPSQAQMCALHHR